jgi:hypothetical protein
MVGLLYALPHTQLTRRLAREGRLHAFVEGGFRGSADQCTQGLNFDTLRPRREILLDYKRVLEQVYHPTAYLRRVRRLTMLLDNANRGDRLHAGDARNRFSSSQMLHRLIANLPEPRDAFWQAIVECAAANPTAARYIVTHIMFYLHLGPFSRLVIQLLERKIGELDGDLPGPGEPASQPMATLARA